MKPHQERPGGNSAQPRRQCPVPIASAAHQLRRTLRFGGYERSYAYPPGIVAIGL